MLIAFYASNKLTTPASRTKHNSAKQYATPLESKTPFLLAFL